MTLLYLNVIALAFSTRFFFKNKTVDGVQTFEPDLEASGWKRSGILTILLINQILLTAAFQPLTKPVIQKHDE